MKHSVSDSESDSESESKDVDFVRPGKQSKQRGLLSESEDEAV